jgi:hypothetical protein
MHDLKRPPSVRAGGLRLDYVLLAIVIVYYLLDSVPRFFQGDSISYLTTDYDLKHWTPPDRSWMFGAMVNFLLRRTHGYEDYVFLQCGLLVAVLLIIRRTLSAEGRWPLAAIAAAGLLAAADPLVEIYARFVMSDFLATAGFFLGLCAVVALHRSGRPATYAALAVVAFVVAVLMRSSYALMIEATLALGLLLLRPRLSRRQIAAIVCVLAAAPAGIGLQIAANRAVFRTTFPHETFVMKNSGVFLAGVFAPALAPQDFAKVGAPVSQAEFDQLDLKNRALRNAQIWATAPRFEHQLLKNKLHRQEDYSAEVDRASKALVISAFERNPAGVISVYLQNAAEYLTPSLWRASAEPEMGLDRDLPDSFLDVSNAATARRLPANITRMRSILIKEYLALSGLYPIQIAFGLAAAVFLLIRERRSASCVFLACAAVITLAMAPLYSVYVIPRYILMTVLANYVLIPLALASLYRMAVRRLRPPVGVTSSGLNI